jgi:hypothetical protein
MEVGSSGGDTSVKMANAIRATAPLATSTLECCNWPRAGV